MDRQLPAKAPWDQIDTVLLDLDGTLLDLAFDNHFWRTLVPSVWGAQRGLDLPRAQAELQPRFAAQEGTLQWYCVEYWTRELGVDIAALKQAHAHQIRWLPGAEQFLRSVRARGKRLVLLTNAHPLTLAVKDGRTGVLAQFDVSISSHHVGVPKEDARFWLALKELEHFEPLRSLFVDDSVPVLRAARRAGIAQVIAVRQPDSGQAPRQHEEFAAVDSVAELL